MKTSEKIVLNIGLRDNPYEHSIAHELVARMFRCNTRSNVHKGAYKDKAEDTMVVVIDCKYGLSDIVIKLEALCLLFEQECIAVKSETFELLVWNPEAESREFGFDREYFIFAQ